MGTSILNRVFFYSENLYVIYIYVTVLKSKVYHLAEMGNDRSLPVMIDHDIKAK